MIRRLAALAAGAAIALSPAAARSQCCTPIAASRSSWPTPSGWDALPGWVGATDDGMVYAVHRDSRVAWLYTSSNAGATFGLPDTDFTEGSLSDAFLLARDGTLLVGYQRDASVWFRRSTDRAASWTPPLQLGPMPAPTSFPHDDQILLVARPGGLTALLALQDQGLGSDSHAAYVSSDTGESWSAALVTTSAHGRMARIAATDTTVAVAYEEAGAIMVRTTSTAGATWTAPVRASSQPLGAYAWHAIASTGPGTFQVVYLTDTSATTTDVRVAVSADDGATWRAADETVIGRAAAPVTEDLFVQPLPSGGLLAGGWLDAGGLPGVATSFSSDGGLPGTWTTTPPTFAPGGRSQHDYRTATLPDDTVLVVHDDYRHYATAECTSGFECEDIYMSRWCPGTATWEEFRLDEDEPPNPTHSEEPAIATTSGGRLHVQWLNTPGPGIAVVQLRSMAVQQATDVPVTLVVTPAPDCLSAAQELRLDSGLPSSCPALAIRWFMGTTPVAGGTGPALLLDPADIDGVNAWHAEISCGPCTFRSLDVVPLPFRPDDPLLVRRTDIPATGCVQARTLLEAVPLTESECGTPAWQWFVDGGAIPGARRNALEITCDAFGAGTHVFRCEARCSPARRCGGSVWPDVAVTIDEPQPVQLPRDVGAALRVRDHGDALAPSISAVLDWTRDEGLPRTGEHYHVLRGTSPALLAAVPGLEPLAALLVTDVTPASPAPAVPALHFYDVRAADSCEDVSLD